MRQEESAGLSLRFVPGVNLSYHRRHLVLLWEVPVPDGWHQAAFLLTIPLGLFFMFICTGK
jgi:hypothetical protein